MKVALLSFHNAYNYGAALQAYGLQYVVEQLDVECEYIDYQNARRQFAYDMSMQIKEELRKKNIVRAGKLICGKPFIESRGKKFDIFYQRYLRKTSRIYHNAEEAKELNSQYDKFIVGSDQVWNYDNSGEDWSFFLSFVQDNSKKISYSSSFGISNIPDRYLDDYSKYLALFDRLSVREGLGVELVEELTGRKAHLVLDPVFLAGRKCWNALCENSPAKSSQPYIFFYTNRPSQVNDFLNTGYDTSGLRHHVLSSHVTPKDFLNPKVDICISMSPQRFIEEIKSAEFVVTASFHCLAMAVIFHKPFCVILTGDYGKDERLLSLLNIIDQKSRILTESTTIADLQKSIDYDEVDKQLKPYMEQSYEYLRRAIFSIPDVDYHTEISNKFCKDSRCTGCTSCVEICPTNAISMKTNAEGFNYPAIDERKCIDCSACKKVCQVFSKTKDNTFKKTYWAVKNKDEIRKQSSSGGMFQALANEILNKGGIVCAAAIDEDYVVKHRFAETLDDLKPMCSTYYVQSEMNGCYSKIKGYLENGRKVLFVGTPCQVQGLNLYLDGKTYNLFTCDIICHGVPSPGVLSEFVAYLRSKGELSSFKFRDKELGWKGYQVSACINGLKVKNELWLQSFNNLFSHNIINRLSCANCSYASYNRCSDITIGDYWGIEKHLSEFADNLGVSLVMCNKEKGANLFESLEYLERVSITKEQSIQNSLLHPAKISSRRVAFYRELHTHGYQASAKRFAEYNVKGWIKNILRKVLR
jgi:coenzyme F420-reducing hydrogenase beta subunit